MNPLEFYKSADVRNSALPPRIECNMHESERTHKLWCRLDQETYEVLQAAARKERRSLTQQVVIAIQTLYADAT